MSTTSSKLSQAYASYTFADIRDRNTEVLEKASIESVESRPLAKVNFRPPNPPILGENTFKVPQNWGI